MIVKKKVKAVIAISIGISCFALAMVIFMQFKVVNQIDITSIENMREAELRTELSNWKEKYDDVNEKNEELIQTLEEYKNKGKSYNETVNLLQEELAQINLELGKTDVEGEGITITIKEENSDTMVSAENLLILVNSLKLAGAEAISINEERIINMTDIVEIGNLFIKVNGQRILAPYIIKAIGPQSYMENSLLGSGGYVDELRKKYNYDIVIEKNKKITINKYEDEIKSKYME